MPRDQERVDSIVGAARSIIEAGGLEALSMRKLAAEVGAAPTTIYWHVGSRRDLLDAVLDRMVADLPPIAVLGTEPRARLASAARSFRDQVRATTATQQLAGALGRNAELSLPIQVTLAREVSAAGLSGADAAQAVRALLFLVGGFILLEDNFAHREPGARTTQELWEGVDDDALDPALRKAMSRSVDTDDLFDYAVDRLLASVLPAV
jgi:TetR/AcrR family transcriptional regulator, tetracycline repressor protein